MTHPRPDFGRHAFAGYRPSAGPRLADPASLQELRGRSMGTSWTLRFVNPRMLPLAGVRATVEGALATVVEQMSHWEKDSDISRFNNAAPGTRRALPAPFATVMRRALYWAEESGGAFDPSAGALVSLWGFGPRERPQDGPSRHTPPSASEIAQALNAGGWRRLRMAPGDTLAQPGGAWLDLSGIAKGFAVDLVASAVGELGVADLLIEIGGELRACGTRPAGQPWRIALEPRPSHAGGPAGRVLALRDLAVATSGDGWHGFEHQGRRYSHTLDPRTGEPVRHALAAVTVAHPRCVDADALTTVLTVLGPREGFDFAVARGVAALFVERQGQVLAERATPEFERLFA